MIWHSCSLHDALQLKAQVSEGDGPVKGLEVSMGVWSPSNSSVQVEGGAAKLGLHGVETEPIFQPKKPQTLKPKHPEPYSKLPHANPKT